MSVPPEILAVNRPANTVVIDNGGKGPRRFAVLERIGSVYRPGKGSSPRNGKVVGHIIDGEFLPVESELGPKEQNLLSYGLAAILKKLMEDVVKELFEAYDISTVCSLMALINVKVKRPDVSNPLVASIFRTSFASLYWPGAAVSKNTLYSLATRLGEDGIRRQNFFQSHISKLGSNPLVVVGMFNPDNKSEVDNLSDFTYKLPPDWKLDVWVLYAFCVDTGEPICSEAFLGDCEDPSAFAFFMEENGIKSGLIINELFSSRQVDEVYKNRADVHFLSTLDEKSKNIGKYRTRPCDGTFVTETDLTVLFWKDKLKGGKFLYSFQDSSQRLKEKIDGPDPSASSYEWHTRASVEKQEGAGAIELLGNLDMDPKEVFHIYAKRKLIELALSYYSKKLTRTRALSYYSVKGNGFINFLCALASCRILNAAQSAGLLKEMTYGNVVYVLDETRRKRGAPLDRLPRSNDPYWFNVDASAFEVLEALGLCEKERTDKHRKGRPRKQTDPNAESRPKRPRGRPRKERLEFVGPKRPVGRPSGLNH